MALVVCRWIAWRADRVVRTNAASGVAAMARVCRTNRRSRSHRRSDGAGGWSRAASIECEFARCRRREARRAVGALRRAIPFARDHARRLSHLPDDRILRLWHPRAVGARVEGLLGCDVADVHDAHIHRLSGWFGP